MAVSIEEKARRFKALHEAPGAFVIANAWDTGSARILAGVGFLALATSSGASANALGRRDGELERDEALAQAQLVADATELPVSADLENGFGDTPEEVADTIRRAASIGLVGGSIEDFTGRDDQPFYDFDHAVERVAAAAELARSLPFPFTLTARTENFLHGKPDLDDTIRRLQAFESAGADVLFAPGLPDLAAVKTVCQSLSKPVNFMAGIPKRSFSIAGLEAAGVKRISLAGSLYRASAAALVKAAREITTAGTFEYLNQAISTSELSEFMKP